MLNLQLLTLKHNLVSETKFQLKSSIHIGQRYFHNLFSGINKFSDTGRLINAPVIAVSESELWNKDDNAQNWILTAGKIQNLRTSAAKLNGLEVDGNAVFSFWKHLGNPNLRRGYVVGREIREGCIVPTIAGGLCQLSNALYDAALKANFEIIERHKHTKVIKGSLAEQDRDATVKWNYVDLRFKSSNAFRIEIDISADKLVVSFKSMAVEKQQGNAVVQIGSNKLNDCYSCGNLQCFKHPKQQPYIKTDNATAWLVNEWWPEYEAYAKVNSKDGDVFIVPDGLSAGFGKRNTRVIKFAKLRQKLFRKYASITSANVFEADLSFDKWLATEMAAVIPIECTHLVVSQSLLPILWQSGCLGGRTYDVLMTRLPFERLHAALNAAHELLPESPTLNDFRVEQILVDAESKALTRAAAIITPHHQVADVFKNKVVLIDWVFPTPVSLEKGRKILFPASGVARKGAFEIRKLASELEIELLVTGKAMDFPGFWQNSQIDFVAKDILKDVGLVILPAYIEHQPRVLLNALANGIPVIATSACGLKKHPNLTIVKEGNYFELKQAVLKCHQQHTDVPVIA